MPAALGLRVSTRTSPFATQISLFARFVNNSHRLFDCSRMYVETILGGAIFFYDTWEGFQEFHAAYPRLVGEFKQDLEPSRDLDPESVRERQAPDEQEGQQVHFKVVCHDPQLPVSDILGVLQRAYGHFSEFYSRTTLTDEELVIHGVRAPVLQAILKVLEKNVMAHIKREQPKEPAPTA